MIKKLDFKNLKMSEKWRFGLLSGDNVQALAYDALYQSSKI